MSATLCQVAAIADMPHLDLESVPTRRSRLRALAHGPWQIPFFAHPYTPYPACTRMRMHMHALSASTTSEPPWFAVQPKRILHSFVASHPLLTSVAATISNVATCYAGACCETPPRPPRPCFHIASLAEGCILMFPNRPLKVW